MSVLLAALHFPEATALAVVVCLAFVLETLGAVAMIHLQASTTSLAASPRMTVRVRRLPVSVRPLGFGQDGVLGEVIFAKVGRMLKGTLDQRHMGRLACFEKSAKGGNNENLFLTYMYSSVGGIGRHR